MTKRKLLVGAGLLTVFVCAGLVSVVTRPPEPNGTKAGFDRIKRGMTRAEVEAIFGKPNMESAHDNASAWGDGDEEIAAVWYDEQGRVGLKAWLRKEP